MKLPCTLKLRHTGSDTKGGGVGPMVTENLSCTLAAAVQDQTLITGGGTAYGINPQGGGMNPCDEELGETQSVCHQGGVMQVNDNDLQKMRYIVRRLTPTECERLMGLSDGYTIPTGLRRFFDADGEPSPELVAEFQRIHDTFGAIMAAYEGGKPPKPKSAAQVQKWLAKITDPATCPDSPRYKGCGNGWATNQPRWILMRLLHFMEQESTQTQTTQNTKGKE